MNSPDLSKRHFLNQSLQLAKQAGAFYAVNAVSQPFNTLRWVLQESIPQEEQAIEPSDVFAETLLPDAYYGVPLRQVDLGVTPAGQLFATTLTYEEIDGKRYDSLIINDINEPSPDQPEFGVTETVVRFLREGGQPWTSTIKTTRLNDTTVGTTYYDPVRQQHVLEFYHKSPPGWSKGDTIEVRNQDYPDAYRDLINGQNQVLRTDSLPHAALVLTHDVITEGTMVLISDTLTIIKPDGTEDVRYFVKDFTILKKTGSVVVRSVDGTFEHFSIDSDGTLHELAAPATDFIFDHSARMFDTCDEDELVSIVADNNRKLHTFEYSQETDEWREYSVHDLSHLDYPDHPGFPSTFVKVGKGPRAGSLMLVSREDGLIRSAAAERDSIDIHLPIPPAHDEAEPAATDALTHAYALHIIMENGTTVSVPMSDEFYNGFMGRVTPAFAPLHYNHEPLAIGVKIFNGTIGDAEVRNLKQNVLYSPLAPFFAYIDYLIDRLDDDGEYSVMISLVMNQQGQEYTVDVPITLQVSTPAASSE